MRLSLIMCLLSLGAGVAVGAEKPLVRGDSVRVGGVECTVTKLESLPYVENEYSRRFKFDRWDNPKLKELREKYHLDEVVAPGKDEFDRQVLLLDWVNRKFHKFGKPSSQATGALDILAANDAGHTFFCAHYAEVFVSAAASLGWVDRSLALRRPDQPGRGGSTEHTSTEIWSNQYGKWVMMDPTFGMYIEKDGVPLSAYEFRQEWFYHDGSAVTFVLGKERQRYHKSDMPVFRKRFPGFGDLSLDSGATDVYAFIGYIPNTNLMDAGKDYGGMFITQDKVCEGTKWHKRTVPKDPAHEPYFPIGQAAMMLTAEGGGIHVGLKTLTPNFKTYMARVDGGSWKACGEAVDWKLHRGANRVEVRTVNQFGVEGPISVAEVRGN
jgi:hypothetical protein